MHLTQFSDYGLRLVIYLACHPEQLVSVDQISSCGAVAPATPDRGAGYGVRRCETR